MCAYADRYRRILILLATSALSQQLLIDRGFLERLAIDEGVARPDHQPLLEAVMLVLCLRCAGCDM